MDWTAVALVKDIPAGTVVPRRVAETDLAIWCGTNGQFHAWGDRCPHRGMRLSHGFVRGDTLACIYHGWQYDEDGACTYIPAHPKLTPPKTICAQTYPCKEDGGIVWLALDDADGALPDLGGRVSVRSMEVLLAAEVLAQRLSADVASLVLIDSPLDIAIAVQPSTANSCVIHVMAGPDADPKFVSRYMEAWRVEVEAAE